MQTENRVIDSIAKAFTNAAGAAQAFREEAEVIIKGKIERLIADMDLVTREDFEAAKAMAAKARAENEKLESRVAELEAKLGIAKKDSTKARRAGTQRAKSTRPKKRAAKL